MLFLLLSLVIYCTGVYAQSQYFIGQAGESCNDVCFKQSMNCNPRIETGGSTALFQKLGIKCINDTRPWWATNQPGYVSDPKDAGNYGHCLGYVSVPTAVQCGGSFYSVQRLCRCDMPTKSKKVFGHAVAAGYIDTSEQSIFQHFVAPGDYGVMNHFWFTVPNPAGDRLFIKYYIDGEKVPLIQFSPSLACGVGYNDTTAPWGTKWIGKGSHDGSYFINFKIPFQKSIFITAQLTSGNSGGFYMIVRGATNLPLSYGNVAVPPTARMVLLKVAQTYKPLDHVILAQVASGAGAVFMHSLTVASTSPNFIEGCYHWFTPDNNDFPGVVLSSGTEDYYDSGWSFNAGPFQFPVSGMTHFDQQQLKLSAYRFHEQDPLIFDNGFTFQWRNGDVLDKSGNKCLTLVGDPVGTPKDSYVQSYVWVYLW